MALAAFNPNDFILQDIASPDNKKTLVEYDAAHRMMLFRVKEFNNGQEEINYKAIYFKENINQNFLSSLPDEFSSDKDQLLLFSIYDDGTYDLVKQKMKYDFASQSTRWVKYESNELTTEEAKEIFETLKSMLFIQQVLEKKEKNDAILEILNKQEYFDIRYNDFCNQRDVLLRESDYRVLDDYPESFTGEKDLWLKWRDTLRTYVKSSVDFETGLEYIAYCEQFKWPIDPLVYHAKYPELNVEYLTTEDQYNSQYESVSSEAQKRISSSVLAASLETQMRSEKGIPVSKQVLDIIEKYRLLDGVLELDINELTLEG